MYGCHKGTVRGKPLFIHCQISENKINIIPALVLNKKEWTKT